MLNTSQALKLLALCSAGALSLTACQSSTPKATTDLTASKPKATNKSAQSKLDTILSQAAAATAKSNQQQRSLSYLEKLYVRSSEDVNTVYSYAKALRQMGQHSKANTVISPLAFKKSAHVDILTEYSHIQSSLGNFATAEEYAKKALKNSPVAFRAHHALGIALDAQGRHAHAEKAFRKALDMWQGDPIPLLNNLALCLTAQGYLDEAVMLLQKAHDAVPSKKEIERNLRIVKTLRESTPSYSPMPIKKPPKS